MTISHPLNATAMPDEPAPPESAVSVAVVSAPNPKADFPYHVRRRWPALVIAGTQLLLDLTCVGLAFYVAWRGDHSLIASGFNPPDIPTYWLMLAVVLVTMLVSFNVAGLYTLKRGVSRVDEFVKTCSATSVGVVLGLAVNAFILGSAFVFSRQLLLVGWGWRSCPSRQSDCSIAASSAH